MSEKKQFTVYLESEHKQQAHADAVARGSTFSAAVADALDAREDLEDLLEYVEAAEPGDAKETVWHVEDTLRDLLDAS